MNEQVEEMNEIEIDLRDLFFHFFKNWRFIVIVTVLGLFCGTFYVWKIQVPKYQASAMIYLRDSNTQISFNDLQVNSELSSDYTVILKSKPLLNRVISDLDLKMSYNELYNSTTVTTLEDTRILKITIVNPDAQLAAELVNQLVDRGVDTIEEIESKQPYTVEKADVNYNKVNTSNSKILLIGCMCGLVVSLGALFIQYLLNDKLRSAEDIEKVLQVPVLAGIGENRELDNHSRGGKHHGTRIHGNKRSH